MTRIVTVVLGAGLLVAIGTHVLSSTPTTGEVVLAVVLVILSAPIAVQAMFHAMGMCALPRASGFIILLSLCLALIHAIGSDAYRRAIVISVVLIAVGTAVIFWERTSTSSLPEGP